MREHALTRESMSDGVFFHRPTNSNGMFRARMCNPREGGHADATAVGMAPSAQPLATLTRPTGKQHSA